MKCKHCDADAIGRGLCRKHYMRAARAGTLTKNKTKSDKNPVKKRLLSKYIVTASGCWEWLGFRKPGKFPYGMIWVSGRLKRAHRISYEVHKGPIPDGIDVLHECDNPPCINPRHLFLGTRGDNCIDCADKNRFPLNKRHHATKISAADAIRIRNSAESQAVLSDRYGVRQGHISRIRNGLRRTKAELG